jgi:hypothetical protein
MTSVDLTLPFLEQRTYLHGTTLFDELRQYAAPGASLSFRISRRIESNRVRLVDAAHSRKQLDPAATLDWRSPGMSASIGVIQLPSLPPIERKPYDESLVTRSLTVGAEEVTLIGTSPFTLVATLVPMFKVLLKGIHRSGDPGQWMFTRLDLDAYPSSHTALALHLDRVLGGTLAKAHVVGGGQACGAIYYSWV